MEKNRKINLLSQHDFGDNYNVIINFTRQNLGAILKGMIVLIPIIMIAMIPLTMMQSEILEMAQSNILLSDPDYIWEFYARMLTPYTIIAYIAMLAVAFVLPLYPMCYVILYVKSEDGVVLTSDVWKMVKKVVLPLLLCSILAWIMISIGMILCIIPGIILGIFIIYYPYTYASEDSGIIGSFKRSFELVKDNWWYTFLTILVTIVIMFFVSIAFSMPNFISNIFSSLFRGSSASSILSYITYLIAYIGGLFTYIFFAIVVGVMYYNRLATVDNYTSDEQINSIGSNTTTYY